MSWSFLDLVFTAWPTASKGIAAQSLPRTQRQLRTFLNTTPTTTLPQIHNQECWFFSFTRLRPGLPRSRVSV
ncbi:hypothetical protein R3P38DRAFT_1716403 [Favolaschia claudopus]|uniref:Secreted protein n=1 Tax=Favolaschia claudopus TaxID=2862362 RepID=A0AAW0A9H2_9AGAR